MGLAQRGEGLMERREEQRREGRKIGDTHRGGRKERRARKKRQERRAKEGEREERRKEREREGKRGGVLMERRAKGKECRMNGEARPRVTQGEKEGEGKRVCVPV